MGEDRKKQHIIEATAALLMKQGVKKTSVEDIAKNAGVSKVTVYKYFTDKSGLLGSVCVWLISRCLRLLKEQADSDMDTMTRMMGFTKVLGDFISSGEQALCAELSSRVGRAAADYTAFEGKVREMIDSLIREGKEVKLIDANIGSEAVYHYINMGLCYFQHDAAYRDRMRTDATFREAFLWLLWRNIHR